DRGPRAPKVERYGDAYRLLRGDRIGPPDAGSFARTPETCREPGRGLGRADRACPGLPGNSRPAWICGGPDPADPERYRRTPSLPQCTVDGGNIAEAGRGAGYQ